MNWTELDWKCLERLRETFLAGKPSQEAYWQSHSDLENYDLTFGERIGWKWDAVLDELVMRGWKPPGGLMLDWGCGSGVAGRRVLRRFGAGCVSSLAVWDRSPLAADFAFEAARREFPGLDAACAAPGFLDSDEPIGLLVVSHVINELSPAALREVLGLARRCRAVLWTEPGTRDASRALGAVRDALAADFGIVAPCTRQGPCPVLAPENERHWCHFFAHPPAGVLADSNWVKFGQRAGIDMRSLPYAFVALDRGAAGTPHGLSRVIGRPEHFKPYARLLNCDETGLAELSEMRRTHVAHYNELDKNRKPLVYAWLHDGAVVTETPAEVAPGA